MAELGSAKSSLPASIASASGVFKAASRLASNKVKVINVTLEDLIDIESIKQLKARYFRLMDTKQWDSWAEVFTDDFYGIYTGDHPDIEFHGRDDMVSKNRSMLGEHPTIHHGVMPEIILDGSTLNGATLNEATTASGIWAMMDYVDIPAATFKAFGHYHDKYRKEAGVWRIAETRLTRLRVDVVSG